MTTLYRADGLIDLEKVQSRTIVFAGLGSLGSGAASALAYPFGRIHLADPDVLAVHNVERHVLGMSDVGRPKVEAMRDYLVNRGLEASLVRTFQGPAQSEALLGDCPDDTIVVASVDGYAARAAINAVCQARNFPVVFGGVYPKGSGGDIAILPQPATTCYLCSGWLTMPVYSGHQGRDYGIDPTDVAASATRPAIPALKAPVLAIAADMAMAVLGIIAGSQQEARLVRHVHDWEAVYEFDEQPDPRQRVGRFISAMGDMGFDPGMRLNRHEKGFTWEISRGMVTFVLSTWSGCPLHSPKMSAEDI